MRVCKDKRGFIKLIGILLVVVIIFYLLYMAVDACLRQAPTSGSHWSSSLLPQSSSALNLQRIRYDINAKIRRIFNR